MKLINTCYAPRVKLSGFVHHRMNQIDIITNGFIYKELKTSPVR